MTRARAVPRLALLGVLTLASGGCAALHSLVVPPPLTVGQRVRVTVPDSIPPTWTATLVALTTDSLVVGPDTAARSARPPVVTGRLALPLEVVDNLEVSRGIHTDVVEGSLAGIVIGSLVGFGVLCTRINDCLGHGDTDARLAQSLGIIGVSAAGGLVIGGTVGAFVRSEHWDVVPVIGPGGAQVGLSARSGSRLAVGVRLFPAILGPRGANAGRGASSRNRATGLQWERVRRDSR